MTPRSPVAALALLGCAACGPAEPLDLRLELVDGGCSAEQLVEVSVVSVEVWGDDGAGDMCTLGKRCVFDVDLRNPTSVEDIEAAISEVNQPLIDVEIEGSRFVALVGRRQTDGCFMGVNPPACANADIADASNGVLPMTLRCGDCQSFEDYPLCP